MSKKLLVYLLECDMVVRFKILSLLFAAFSAKMKEKEIGIVKELSSYRYSLKYRRITDEYIQ